MIYSILESQMRGAVDNEDNRKADGSINWDFVDAICYREVIDFCRSRVDYYEMFNDIADMIEAEMPVDTAVQLEFAL